MLNKACLCLAFFLWPRACSTLNATFCDLEGHSAQIRSCPSAAEVPAAVLLQRHIRDSREPSQSVLQSRQATTQLIYMGTCEASGLIAPSTHQLCEQAATTLGLPDVTADTNGWNIDNCRHSSPKCALWSGALLYNPNCNGAAQGGIIGICVQAPCSVQYPTGYCSALGDFCIQGVCKACQYIEVAHNGACSGTRPPWGWFENAKCCAPACRSYQWVVPHPGWKSEPGREPNQYGDPYNDVYEPCQASFVRCGQTWYAGEAISFNGAAATVACECGGLGCADIGICRGDGVGNGVSQFSSHCNVPVGHAPCEQGPYWVACSHVSKAPTPATLPPAPAPTAEPTSATPAPTPASCILQEFIGQYIYGHNDLGWTPSGKTLEDCKALCCEDAACKSFDYNQASGSCGLSSSKCSAVGSDCKTGAGAQERHHEKQVTCAATSDCKSAGLSGYLCDGKICKASYSYLKIANGGIIPWKPVIGEIQLFSDTACTVSVAIPSNGGWDAVATACPASGCELCSGWDNIDGDLSTRGCQLAIDGSTSTSWRPKGGTKYQIGSLWMTFRLPSSSVVRCVKASYLGSGAGGGYSWNEGLQVSTSTDAQTWQSMMRDARLSGTDMNAFVWQALAWTLGQQGESCNDVCTGVKASCVDGFWPSDEGSFDVIATSAGHSCSSTIAGGADHNPSIVGSTCFWSTSGGNPGCLTSHPSARRFCPCQGGLPKCDGCTGQCECWDACGGGGYCSACDSSQGAPGACCRIDNGSHADDDPPECQVVKAANFRYSGHYTCVLTEEYFSIDPTGWCTPSGSNNYLCGNGGVNPINMQTCIGFPAGHPVQAMSDAEAQSRCNAEPNCDGYTRWWNGHALDGKVRFQKGITGVNNNPGAKCYKKRVRTSAPTPVPTPDCSNNTGGSCLDGECFRWRGKTTCGEETNYECICAKYPQECAEEGGMFPFYYAKTCQVPEWRLQNGGGSGRKQDALISDFICRTLPWIPWGCSKGKDIKHAGSSARL